MDNIHPVHYAAIGLAVATVLLLVLLLLLKKKNTLLSQQLAQQISLLEETRKQLTAAQEKHDEILAFQNSLKTAELTTMLQKTRLDSQRIVANHALSGKYGNIQSLAQKGMSVDEIAAILAVSTHEARQLVNLSKLAQGNSPGNNST